MESHRTLSVKAACVVVALLISVSFGCTREERAGEPASTAFVASSESININSATQEELQRIPYIGENLAEKIIVHREKYGPFRKTEHLMLLNGISDRRFREIRHLVRVN